MWTTYYMSKALFQAERAIGLARDRFHVSNLLRFYPEKSRIAEIEKVLSNCESLLNLKYHGLVSLLWAKSHGFNQLSNELQWSLDNGVLPTQHILAESIELISVGSSFTGLRFGTYGLYESNHLRCFQQFLFHTAMENLTKISTNNSLLPCNIFRSCEILLPTYEANLYNRSRDQSVNKLQLIEMWEKIQLSPEALAYGCRGMAILADHDGNDQLKAYMFGKYFGLALELVNIFLQYAANLDHFSEVDLPLAIYINQRSKSEPLKASDLMMWPLKVEKIREEIKAEGSSLQYCQNLANSYINKCMNYIPEKPSLAKDSLIEILKGLRQTSFHEDVGKCNLGRQQTYGEEGRSNFTYDK